MSAEIISFKFTNGCEIRRDEQQFLCLTDMWRAAGSDPSKKPHEWLRSEQSRQFREFLEENLTTGNSRSLVETREGRSGGTWAHWQLAMAYAKYLSPEFHAWCNDVVRRVMQGEPVNSAELVLADRVTGAIEKMSGAMQTLAASQIETNARLTGFDDRLTGVEVKVDRLQETISTHLDHKRKSTSERTRKAHIEAIQARGGVCPCCERTRLFDAAGEFIGHIDHHEKASDNRVESTWPVCVPCNRGFGVRPRCKIDSYHLFRMQYSGPLFRLKA